MKSFFLGLAVPTVLAASYLWLSQVSGSWAEFADRYREVEVYKVRHARDDFYDVVVITPDGEKHRLMCVWSKYPISPGMKGRLVGYFLYAPYPVFEDEEWSR
jgi:hypothetical protein